MRRWRAVAAHLSPREEPDEVSVLQVDGDSKLSSPATTPGVFVVMSAAGDGGDGGVSSATSVRRWEIWVLMDARSDLR